MPVYSEEIQKVVNTALEELKQQHKQGKLANTPVSNTHFLVRWVTKSLKNHRFHSSVGKDLIRWQKMGRSKGTESDLLFTFENISRFYGRFLPEGEAEKPIRDADIEAFLDQMEEQQWSVCTEHDLTEKTQIFTEGDSSLVLCARQCDECFEGGEILVKPISFFVRGNHAEFIRLATEAGFLVHKRTDYKSVVKYHGEYLVYPGNQGKQLAEIPIGF